MRTLKTQAIYLFFLVIVSGSFSFGGSKHVIFIPGFGGTELFNAQTNQKLWPSVPELLWGNGSVTLPVPGLELSITPVRLGGVAQRIKVGPVTKNIYGSTVKTLQKIALQNQAEFHAVTYDWRLEPYAGVLAIAKVIEGLNLRPEDEIYFYAHSYGGLILSYFLRYGTQIETDPNITTDWSGSKNVKAAFILGAPFGGNGDIYKALKTGIVHLIDGSMFKPFNNGTFPSAYFLLPKENRAIVKFNKDFHTFDQSNVQEWKKLGLGLFSGPECYLDPDTLKSCETFTSYWYERAMKFQSLIFEPSESQALGTQLFFVNGYGSSKTPSFAMYDLFEPKKVKIDDSIGDGVVRFDQMIPEWLTRDESKIFSLKKNHFGILTDRKVLQEFSNSMN